MKKVYICCLLCFAFMMNYTHAQSNDIPITEIENSIIPFIDKLENNEQYTVHFSSKGCFHNRKEMMTFTKENNSYYVVFKDDKKKLDNISIEKIRVFEKELSLQHDNGCTTIDHYLLIYNKSQRIITDGGCSWRGYTALKKGLGFA